MKPIRLIIIPDTEGHPQCPCLWIADDAGRALPAQDTSPAPDGWRLTEFGGHVGNPGPSGFTEDDRNGNGRLTRAVR